MASTNPMFGLRVSKELLEKLKYVAEYNGRSANREIEQLIKEHISNFEQKHGSITIKSQKK